MPTMPLTFASHLKALRLQAGLTQEELAEKSGLHVGTIMKLERSARLPGVRVIWPLADALAVDANTLLAPLRPLRKKSSAKSTKTA